MWHNVNQIKTLTIAKQKNIVFALTVVLFFIASSCTQNNYPQANNNKINLAAMYYPLASRLHPVYKVYHNSNNASLLFVKIFTTELMFIPSGVEGHQSAKISIDYTLYEVDKDTLQLADSGIYEYTVDEEIVGQRFYTQIPIKTNPNKTYQLKVTTKDKLRKSINIKYLDINKLNEFTAQNYNLTNHNDIPYFSNVVKTASLFKVKHRYTNAQKIYIKFFKQNFNVPKPTYAYNKEHYLTQRPDSLWVFDYSPNLILQLMYEGGYLISIDTAKPGGLLVSNFGDNYPKIQSAYDMLEPIQYISLKKEYDALLDKKNVKLGIDEFWADKGNGISRGRELIRIFYNRVYFSNYYFTSVVPGWATDRGMVYTIFGPPQKLQKDKQSEIWYYWVKERSAPVKFVFNYQPSMYFNNEYVLVRGNNEDWNWQSAVTAWRNGRIYLQD